MPNTKEIAIYIGIFDEKTQKEKWKKTKTFKTKKEGYIAFKDLCKKCAAYSYEELMDIYSTPRLDLELLEGGEKILKWMGIYEKQNEEDEEGVEDSFEHFFKFDDSATVENGVVFQDNSNTGVFDDFKRAFFAKAKELGIQSSDNNKAIAIVNIGEKGNEISIAVRAHAKDADLVKWFNNYVKTEVQKKLLDQDQEYKASEFLKPSQNNGMLYMNFKLIQKQALEQKPQEQAQAQAL